MHQIQAMILPLLIIIFASCTGASLSADDPKALFLQAGLTGKLDFHILEKAVAGHQKIKSWGKSHLLVVIDYSQPSTKERFFVLDLAQKKLLHHTLVAHGKNTGANTARQFSNVSGSLQSSLGFFRTAETYRGKHGYSLKLDGLEKGINDHARERAIVIHGADYVSHAFVQKHGRLGRSWGCPALPQNQTKQIIDLIKSGVSVFAYADNKAYLEGKTLWK